jgi:hypothetical protein
MNLLRRLACFFLGHTPIVERRGDGSVIACERCHCFIDVFVKDPYARQQPRLQRSGLVEYGPEPKCPDALPEVD